jgi:cytochrome c oxidase assembly factor CtaG/polyferredoxin
MDSIAEAVLKSWQLDPLELALILLTGVVYALGWRKLYRQMPHHFGVSRLISFLIGLIVLLIAIASPLDAIASLLLTAHMVQHLLLMMIAPPLILYGSPYLPLLRGLPAGVLKHGLGPFLAWPLLKRSGHFLTRPLFCWLAFIISNVMWHVPVMYELALRSESWHEAEHLCFLISALLFWWPVIQPWPARARWPRWAMLPYLFLADFQNTGLSALLIFGERIIYPAYGAAPRLFAMSALDDQAAAGAIMWVIGSLVYLVPVGLISVEWMSSCRAARSPRDDFSLQPDREAIRQLASRSANRCGGRDLLRVPVIGSVLRWRHTRLVAQALMFTLALMVIADGLFGHQMGSMNLTGALVWTHWRGIAMITLLIAGNFLCMACPFMFTRNLARRFLPVRWRWPTRLRSKWLAVALLALYLWAYHAFNLWDSPWWTAWVAIGYFAAALVIDGLFQGASFCKYVCPIGQYNFIHSMVSPLEVKARNIDVCRTCSTHDCIRGNAIERGCETELFLPKKSGNLDCTFCLDCLHACPHQNVSIISIAPMSQLTSDLPRSSIGRISQRADIAALTLLLVAGGFANAAGMITPVTNWEKVVQNRLGFGSLLPITSSEVFLALLVAPALLAGSCGLISKALSGSGGRWKELTCSFVTTLVPLGFSMWLAHMLFHLLTAALSIVPAMQRAALDINIGLLGNPDWRFASPLLPIDWLPSLQILLLDFGLLMTLYASWCVALRLARRSRSALGLLAPWATLSICLYALGVWIVLQPMQMPCTMGAMSQ